MTPTVERNCAAPESLSDASLVVEVSENQPSESARTAATRYTNWD